MANEGENEEELAKEKLKLEGQLLEMTGAVKKVDVGSASDSPPAATADVPKSPVPLTAAEIANFEGTAEEFGAHIDAAFSKVRGEPQDEGIGSEYTGTAAQKLVSVRPSPPPSVPSAPSAGPSPAPDEDDRMGAEPDAANEGESLESTAVDDSGKPIPQPKPDDPM